MWRENRMKMIILFFLIYEAVEDIKNRSISVMPLIVMGSIGFVINIISGKELISLIPALTIGMGMIIFSIASKECVGLGDGVLLLVIGTYIDFDNLITILMSSLIIAAIITTIILVLSKIIKLDTVDGMPFIPCILISYLGVMYL